MGQHKLGLLEEANPEYFNLIKESNEIMGDFWEGAMLYLGLMKSNTPLGSIKPQRFCISSLSVVNVILPHILESILTF